MANLVRRSYDLLKHLPGGKRLFSEALGRAAPYSGSVGARVLEVRPGYARVMLRDRRAVRNHLQCVHAVALVNLGEIASGLATLYGLPDDARGILMEINAEYLKKARGRLIAEGSSPIVETSARTELLSRAEIRDQRGVLVTRVTAKWLISRVRP